MLGRILMGAGVFLTAIGGYLYYENTLIHRLRVTVPTAKELIRRNRVDKIVDVRTDAEWALGHYPRAIHIPVSRISTEAKRKLRKTDRIILQCNTGTRARNAALVLEKMGYKNVQYIAETQHSLL